jgi:oligoribonuclease
MNAFFPHARNGMGIEHNLVWVDLEMSGLEVETCRIIEIAALVTDADLNVVAEGPDLVIHQPETVLAAMDPWNTEHHGASGLTEGVRRSTIGERAAELRMLDFLAQHTQQGASPLCGNTIGNDRKFIEKYMPELGLWMHYRSVDVSSIKELVRRWYGEAAVMPKRRPHRALDDIKESLAELRFYREKFFVKPPLP